MTEAPKPLSLNLPASWAGGVFEHAEPAHTDWYLEERAESAWRTLMADWQALEDLPEADPPPVWGLDPGGGGGPPVPVATELVTGIVSRVASGGGGLQLEEYGDRWFDVSRFAPGVVLGGIGAGDVLVLECDVARSGKRFIKSVRFHQVFGE